MSSPSVPPSSGPSARIPLLDALRGFAITGIVFVNIPDMTELGQDLPGHGFGTASAVLNLAVQTRFVPIFEFLFGVSMWFVVRAARERRTTPWLAMVLRLVALFAIGFLHSLVYPGEVLTVYAVAGLLVLPVVLLAPRWLQLALGVAVEAVLLALAGSTALEAPALMLIGAAAAAYGVPAALDRGGRRVGAVFAVAVLVAVPAVWLQAAGTLTDPRFDAAGGRAGLVMAVVYVCGLSLLWGTPARTLLAGVFEPIGRMALTSYVTASLVVVPAGLLMDLRSASTMTPALLLGAGVIAAQSIGCRLWLRRFVIGPLEWGWRAVTWRTVPVLRRRPAPAPSAVV